MGLLAPLYLAGLAALSLPLIFHLVRRTPRGRQDFSSLMFLSPTPPQLTRRSRLDQVLLLLLRAAALAILAVAFGRPFLRESSTLALDDLPRRKVAILLDTSASMRRADLWQQALRKIDEALDDLNPHDELALYAFADRLHPILDFEKEPSDVDRKALVRTRAKSLAPTWEATNLGTALVSLAGELDASADVRQSPAEPQIILISDLQKGANLDALQSFEWPSRVRLIVHPVEPKAKTNGAPQALPSEGEKPSELRVRVFNAADSTSDQFTLEWALAKGSKPAPVPVYVPPGQTRIVRLPRPPEAMSSDQFILKGDDHPFDNTFFVVPLKKQEVRLLYIGADGEKDPQGLQYYLRLAVADDPLRSVEVQAVKPDAAVKALTFPAPQLVVVSREVPEDLIAPLSKYAENGGFVLAIPPLEGDAAGIAKLLGDAEVRTAPEMAEGKYLLLGQIDFTHPLFLPFSNPQFSDFTKIHFWGHRPFDLKKESPARAIARFDNVDPAVIERGVGKGRVLVLTSGWNPDESQLALSGKFVPFTASLLDLACGATQASNSVTIGEAVPLSSGRDGEAPAGPRAGTNAAETARQEPRPPVPSHAPVQKPDGRKVATAGSSFTESDIPGVYRVVGIDDRRWAVNIVPAESNTAPLPAEQLEQFGVRLGTQVKKAERLDRLRQERDMELEGRQKVWRWLIAGAIGLLILETFLAGRASMQTAPAASTPTGESNVA